MSADKPRRLGKGLNALFPDAAPRTTTPTAKGANAKAAPSVPSAPGSDLQRIAVSRIRPNPYQPRREFDAAELKELESSLAKSGLLQPITVRRRGDAYELVAGERRLRAATNLGWSEISAIVREFSDEAMLVLALVENLQRSNLNPIDEARGYRRLLDEFGLTQAQIGEAVGKDRTTVTNLLRVLTLPDSVQRLVSDGALSGGHARALLALTNLARATDLARRASAMKASVRDLEQWVRDSNAPAANRPHAITSTAKAGGSGAPPRGAASTSPSATVRQLEDRLRKHFQTDAKVVISSDAKGKIELGFYSVDDLERLSELLLGDLREDL